MPMIPKRRDTRPLEKDVETRACAYGRKTGWIMRKYTSPAHRSVPDRMCLHDFKTIIFIEFKREGEVASKAQEIEHHALRMRGFDVYVCDNVSDAQAILDKHNPYNS
jgi:hypothetical protein